MDEDEDTDDFMTQPPRKKHKRTSNDRNQCLNDVSPRPLTFAGHMCPRCTTPFACPAVLQTKLVGDTITTAIGYLSLDDRLSLSQCSKFYNHYVKKTLKINKHQPQQEEIVNDKHEEEESDEMREAIARSLRETHGNQGDAYMPTKLISIRLPCGNLDFCLTESNGMCVAGQLPAAASTSATSAHSAIELGDVIFSMNGIDFEGIGGLSVWNELLQSAKNAERVLLVSRRVVQDVDHGRVGSGMDTDDDDTADTDVLSLPFCQGKTSLTYL